MFSGSIKVEYWLKMGLMNTSWQIRDENPKMIIFVQINNGLQPVGLKTHGYKQYKVFNEIMNFDSLHDISCFLGC